jgi:hypothetical protein
VRKEWSSEKRVVERKAINSKHNWYVVNIQQKLASDFGAGGKLVAGGRLGPAPAGAEG